MICTGFGGGEYVGTTKGDVVVRGGVVPAAVNARSLEARLVACRRTETSNQDSGEGTYLRARLRMRRRSQGLGFPRPRQGGARMDCFSLWWKTGGAEDAMALALLGGWGSVEEEVEKLMEPGSRVGVVN